jgi:hypothetical protein
MIALLGIVALCSCQQAVDFDIELPTYFSEFVADGDSAYTAKSSEPAALVKIARFTVSSGAYLESILSDVKKRQWLSLSESTPGMSVNEWRGKLSVLDAGGFEVEFNQSIVLQRIALSGDTLIIISWESPIAYADDGRRCLSSFGAPSEWLSVNITTSDMYQGEGPLGLAPAFPGSMVVSVSLATLAEDEMISVTVGFVPTNDALEFKWQLPAFAVNSEMQNEYSIKYQLAVGKPQASDVHNGIFRFSDNDLIAFDPLWLAVPTFDSKQPFAPPRWQLSLEYAPHLIALSAPMFKVDIDEKSGLKSSVTQIVPAGNSWPFFTVANYRALFQGDFKWFLRLDSKSKLPDVMVAQLLELDAHLTSLIGQHKSEFTIASFPYAQDRSFLGLLIFDEDKGWFDSPTDAVLEGVTRRTQLARYLCEYRFGIECRGLGTAKLFLTRSLAEYLSHKLLGASGFETDAEQLLANWQTREQQMPPLTQALSLLDINDLYGARRTLSFGALVWRDIDSKLSENAFAKLCKQIYSKSAYSAKDLQTMLQLIAPSTDWQSYFKKHVFGIQLPS